MIAHTTELGKQNVFVLYLHSNQPKMYSCVSAADHFSVQKGN